MVQAISQFDLLEAVKRHGQRVVAVASAISLVCIFCAFWSWMPPWKDYELLSILPFWVSYVFVLTCLYEGRVETGLALAAAMGCALFVPGIFLFRFVLEWQRSWWIQTNLALALLMQPFLVAAAVWTFTSMGRAPRDLFKTRGSVGYGKMRGGVGYGILLFGLFWLLYSPVPRLIRNNEADAEYTLRGICERAFMGSLLKAKESGPECDVDNLRDLLGPAKHGYTFEYHSVVPETPMPACKVARGYFLTARPVDFRKTGIRSFLVYRGNPDNPDRSEFYVRIHFTSEDRPATVSDPVEEFKLIEHRYGS